MSAHFDRLFSDRRLSPTRRVGEWFLFKCATNCGYANMGWHKEALRRIRRARRRVK